LLRTITKENELFEQNPDDVNFFTLKEQNLFRIGPMHEAVRQLYKRTSSIMMTVQQTSELDEPNDYGPKTRGASKRRITESVTPQLQKKTRLSQDFVTSQIPGSNSSIDFPFNREGYRYYLVEWDPMCKKREEFEMDENISTRTIPSHFCRLLNRDSVFLSPNDRAHQMTLADDKLTLTGYEGYCVARATHSVSYGSWYFEVEFLSQPKGSHARIGWGQSYAVLQACLGYSKFSYSWRSKHGTVFHEGKGRHYHSDGYKEGDIIGCLIILPSMEEIVKQGFSCSELLPPSKKNSDLIRFKHTMFFEENEESAQVKLRPLMGSKIEFFLNGKSCGIAFNDVYFGAYYPAVSIFHTARVRCNFGPNFKFPLIDDNNLIVKPMSERAEQIHTEQALSDILFMVENEIELRNKEENYFNSQ